MERKGDYPSNPPSMLRDMFKIDPPTTLRARAGRP